MRPFIILLDFCKVSSMTFDIWHIRAPTKHRLVDSIKRQVTRSLLYLNRFTFHRAIPKVTQIDCGFQKHGRLFKLNCQEFAVSVW